MQFYIKLMPTIKVGTQKLSSKTKSQVQHQKFMHKKEQVMLDTQVEKPQSLLVVV